MGWTFKSLHDEIQWIKQEIKQCKDMIVLEEDTIKEMNDELKVHEYYYLKGEPLNCLSTCNGCGKDDHGEIWGVRFIREAKSEIRRYKKIIKWKQSVLETMQAQSKSLRYVS